jgi:hypothetical protein
VQKVPKEPECPNSLANLLQKKFCERWDNGLGIRHCTGVNGCESGHWVDSVVSDGEIVKLEDGSFWQMDSVDTVDSSLWLATEDVTACDGKLINTDDNSTVGAHRLQR